MNYSVLNIINGLGNVMGLIIFAIAIIICFFGFKLFKLFIRVYGFFIFGAIGSALIHSLTTNSIIGALFFIGFGCIGAKFAVMSYRVSVFITCAFSTYGLLFSITNNWTIAFVCGMIAGFCSLFFFKPLLIFSTSVPTAFYASAGICALINIHSIPVILVVGVCTAIAGVIFQNITNLKTSNIMPSMK